jgi:hypothetical protein
MGGRRADGASPIDYWTDRQGDTPHGVLSGEQYHQRLHKRPDAAVFAV